ncbi:MAG: polysaccharide biosynthesis tyrosine autokinase [Chlorogloeopsis fritschii C42_A2020_084]|uniref:GumC family protein n=1 Tax=Chlorogloeopsis fritschii TaxID=1124 RepID=UPI0019D8A6D8|nr:polysaccharide biosynthesis tyrosine autokinase [Chlorogloeopsis fritschii]MBF2006302.1 polysaccharide biosynthesis tyrosine autokinase [Chlorogloeopsis fritschii C42_A2020_084]
MDNSSQSSKPYQNQNLLSQQASNSQSLPWLEEQGDDWSLRNFLSLLRRRSLVIAGVATVVMSSVVYLTFKQEKLYESRFRLLVEPLDVDSRQLVLNSGQNSKPEPQSGLDYDSQIQVLRSPELMTKIVRRLQSFYPDITYSSLIQSLAITRLRETKILEVQYLDEDPERAKVVLDEIANAYLKYSLEQRQTSLRQGLNFVEEQLRSMHKRVDQLQREQQIFQQRYGFVDPTTQAQQITTQSTILSEQRQAINQQLATARANLTSLKQQDGEQAALIDAPLYQQLLGQLRQVEIQIAGELTRLQEDNPTIQALKEKRKSLLSLLQQEARRYMGTKLAQATTQVQALEVQSQELAKAEQKLEQKRKQLPILTRQYTELQRKLQVATDSLNRFLNTRETLQVQVAQSELPWQLIQPPVKPKIPVSPNIQRNLMTGFLVSLVLGVGVALLLEKLDNTYHSANSLKKKIKEPLLGVLPFENQLQISQFYTSIQKVFIGTVPDSLPKNISVSSVGDRTSSNYGSKFVEALRVLYTNIQLLSSDRPIRSIVISSPMSGDGKSTVAFHLAQIACAMGQRVLLVDADLRQPMVHDLSNLKNNWGLSNLISTNVPVTEAIQQAPFMKQLSVLTAGPIPPDPTKLLSSEKMKRMIEEFHNNYDLVIYDTPPVVGLADASLLAPHTDGILMVVRMDKTNSSVLKQALDSLRMARINVLGVVGNAQRSNFGGNYDY